ncbi:MAG: arylsulfatase [Colwellia sp.]|nr:arylsulfatase [Colwellia sp.]
MPKFHYIVVTLLCCTSLFSCDANSPKKQSEKQTDNSAELSKVNKPNIIFIMADDLGYAQIGSYGQKIIETPALDKLANEGLRFTQAYAGSTVCAPSRSVLMTGQHTGHTTVRLNKSSTGERIPLNDEDVTIAEVLKGAGYTTGMIGKWGLGEPGTTGSPSKQGWDYFFGYINQHKAHYYFPAHLWRNDNMVNYNENELGLRNTYSQDLFLTETVQFIQKNKDKPFFLYLPSLLPHTELYADDRHFAKYKDKFEETPYQSKNNLPLIEQPRATYAAMVSRLDEYVGKIMAELEAQGIADNTMVIFTSDNGAAREEGSDPDFFNANGELRGIKRDLYEGGIRVPFIVRWPGKVAAGTVDEKSQIAFWDILPTFAEIAGVNTPKNVDGISILPSFLQGETVGNERPLYWEFKQNETIPIKKALRLKNWKMVKVTPESDLELYDLDNDLSETTNIADKHPKIVQKLKLIMEQAGD